MIFDFGRQNKVFYIEKDKQFWEELLQGRQVVFKEQKRVRDFQDLQEGDMSILEFYIGILFYCVFKFDWQENKDYTDRII